MPVASSFRVVDEHTLSKLHETTLDILSNTGIVFRSDACLNIFLQHGARVEGHTAFISEQMVEKAIETAPSSFEWHARKDDKTITVGEQQKGIHVGLNNGAIYIQDRGQGEERRPGRLQDLINLYKLAQQSKICTIVGQIPVEPADITHPLRYLEIFKQLLVHSDKPLFGYVGTSSELAHMFDMIKISLGAGVGDNNIFAKHRIGVSLNPLSPLQYDKIPCETLLAFAGQNQPVMILSCAMAGVTSPIDPMGTVVLQNAEILAGLVLAQLINEGTPVVYSPGSVVPNMRTAAYVTGNPASNLINLTNIQLAKEFYNIPTRCMAGLTDAKIHDGQAGLETMQNYMMLAMGGVNMVNECFGILDSIMTVSYEKFIIDEEIMSRVHCIMKGIDAFEPDFSKQIINDSGHGGSYLMHPSTLSHCRDFWTPSVSTFQSYDNWKKHGSKSVVQRAGDIFKQRLAQCPDKVIEDDIDRELEKYIDQIKERM